MLVSCSATPRFSAYSRACGAPAAEDPDADQADRRRDAAAVFEQIVERLVARRVEVHRDAVDDVLERLARQIELRRRTAAAAGPAASAASPAVEAARELGAPERHRLAARRQPWSAAGGSSSTASSTARQKSQTAMIARRCSAGSTRNE